MSQYHGRRWTFFKWGMAACFTVLVCALIKFMFDKHVPPFWILLVALLLAGLPSQVMVIRKIQRQTNREGKGSDESFK